MKKTTKCLSILLALCMVFTLLAACASSTGSKDPGTGTPGSAAPADSTAPETKSAERQVVRIATGPMGGYNYTLYSGVSDMINKKFPNKYNIAVAMSSGVTESCTRILTDDVDIGTVSLDNIVSGYNGTDEFDGLPTDKIRWLYNTGGSGPTVHWVVPKGSEIKALEDLYGKKVGVGNGYMYKYMMIGLEVAGIDTSKIDISQLSMTDITNGLSDGTLDVGVYSSPHPLTALTDLAVSKGLDMISLPDELVDKIVEAYPFMHKVVIPAGTYPGVDHDSTTYTAYTCWVCNKDVPEETIYDFLTVILEDSEKLGQIHPNAKNITRDFALEGQLIPLHPGAEKYFIEMGMIDADPLKDMTPDP